MTHDSSSSEAMRPRERMLAAMDHLPVDRVPTDIWATGEVWAKLRARFGTPEQVRIALHIDGMAGVDPVYVGPQLAAPPGEASDYWGIRTRPAAFPGGTYDEYSHHPLAGVALSRQI